MYGFGIGNSYRFFFFWSACLPGEMAHISGEKRIEITDATNAFTSFQSDIKNQNAFCQALLYQLLFVYLHCQLIFQKRNVCVIMADVGHKIKDNSNI